MPKKKKKKPDQPQSTAQQLGALIKSARDIMRKDKVRIPTEGAHPFRLIRPTHSEGSRPPIPIDSAHPFRRKAPTYSD